MRMATESLGEKIVKDIKRDTRKQFSSEANDLQDVVAERTFELRRLKKA